MSGEPFDAVQHPPMEVDSEDASQDTSSRQHETDKTVHLGIRTLSSDSTNSAMPSHEINPRKDPAQTPDTKMVDSKRKHDDKKLSFSIQSILDHDDITKNIKLSTNKGNSAFHKVKEGRDTSIDNRSEDMTNCNTGQISPSIVDSPKSPIASYLIKVGSNSENVSYFKKKVSNSENTFLHKDKRNAQQANIEKIANISAAIHPGFKAAAAAAAITLSTTTEHQGKAVTIDANNDAHTETSKMSKDAGAAPHNERTKKQGESQARATKDDRIGIDHHPTAVIHYPPPSWPGGQRSRTLQPHTQLATRTKPPQQLVPPLTPPPPPLMKITSPEICQEKDAPPQLPPPHLWYRQPPPPLPTLNLEQKLVGYKMINNTSGNTVPVNKNATEKIQSSNKNNVQHMNSRAFERKTAQQQSERTQAMPPLPPPLQHHGIRARIENNAGVARTEHAHRDNASSNYEAHIKNSQGTPSYHKASFRPQGTNLPQMGIDVRNQIMQHPLWLAGTPTYLTPPPPLLPLRIRPNYLPASTPARLARPLPAPARLPPIRPIPRYPTQSWRQSQPHNLRPNQAPAPTRLLPFMPLHQQDGPHHIARENASVNTNSMTSHISNSANQHELVIDETDTQNISGQDAKTQDEEDNATIQLSNREKNKTKARLNSTNQYSSLELDSAKALLTKEYSGLQRKKLTDMLLNDKTTITPYLDHFGEAEKVAPLFLPGYIVNTPGCYALYICKSCNKEIISRHNFKYHQTTGSHLNNSKDWIKILVQNNYEDRIQDQTRKIPKEMVNKLKNAIIKHLHILYMTKAKFSIKCGDQLDMCEDQDESESNEVVGPRQQEFPILIDSPKQSNEQDYMAWTRTSQAIRHRCPPKFSLFKVKLLKLISDMYFDRNESRLHIQFSSLFYKSVSYEAEQPQRHWIIKMFEKITKRPNAWRFMKSCVNRNDLTFALKTETQALEVKRVSSMARWLFHIVLDCPFVPVAYISLLAVLMTTNEVQEFETSSVCLNNGIIVDLFLKEGAVTLQSNIEETEIIYPEQEHESDLMCETTQNRNKDGQAWQDENDILRTELPPTTFLPSVGQHIEDEEWLNQTRIQDDIRMNNIQEAKKISKDTKTSNFTQNISAIMNESNICATSNSLHSSNSSIQTIPIDEGQEIVGDNEEVMEVDKDMEDDQEKMEQETEITLLPDLDTTIYVPDLPIDTTEADLLTSFKRFGQVQSISIQVLPESNAKNASITFTNYFKAKSAMSSMNGTMYKNKVCKVFMSKTRSFPKPKDLHTNSPLEKLGKMVQNMPQPMERAATRLTETEANSQENIVGDMAMSKKNYKRKFKAHIDLGRNLTKASRPDNELVLNVDNTKQGVNLQSEVEVQNEVYDQPDTQDIALRLFQHWEENLNFHEDIHKTKNGAFIIKTINELADVAGKATPYQEEAN